MAFADVVEPGLPPRALAGGIAATGPRAGTGVVRAGTERGRQLANIVTAELLVIVVLQKLAIPFSGDSQIALALPIHMAFVGLLISRGFVTVSGPRLLLYTLLVAAATTTHATALIATLNAFSVPSVFLFLVIYASYIFVMHIDRPLYLIIINRFQYVALGVCALVGLDWAFQLVHVEMPNLDKVIPFAYIYNYYNYIQPLKWRSVWMKPNGVFFLESSHVSQFIAMALCIEVVLFRRLHFIAAYAVSVLATFAGTGLFLVVSALPIILFALRPIYLVAAIVAAPLLLVGASYTGWIDNIAHRQDEFDKDGSSANQRFVAPIDAMRDALAAPDSSPMMGIGAGNMPRALNVTWNPLSKVFVEYGVLTFLVWLAYVSVSVFSGGASLIVAFVVTIQFQLLNGALLVPIHTIYCVLLAGGYIVRDEASDADA